MVNKGLGPEGLGSRHKAQGRVVVLASSRQQAAGSKK
jgi:hypothetical protein